MTLAQLTCVVQITAPGTELLHLSALYATIACMAARSRRRTRVKLSQPKGNGSKDLFPVLSLLGCACALSWLHSLQTRTGIGTLAVQGISGIEVRRFYRPEDISQDKAYAAGYREVYASDEILSLEVDQVLGPCMVTAPGTDAGELSLS